MGHEWGHHEPYRAEILHARSLPHPSKISPLRGPYFIDKMRKIIKTQETIDEDFDNFFSEHRQV